MNDREGVGGCSRWVSRGLFYNMEAASDTYIQLVIDGDIINGLNRKVNGTAI